MAPGRLIVDNVCVPAFVMSSPCTSGSWENFQIEYNANFGMQAINIQQSNVVAAASQFNNVTYANYLTQYNGNTFSGSPYTPIWQGQTNACAIFYIKGAASNISFTNGSVFVPQGVTVNYFCPMAFSFGPDWLYGVTPTSSTPSTSATSPNNITFDNVTFDGCLFGFQGTATNLSFSNITSIRYGDLQDGTSGTVTFSASLASNATTATLASAWTYPTGTYMLTLSNGQIIYTLLTNGSTTCGTFQSLVNTTIGLGLNAAGITTLTLSAAWPYTSGSYLTTFSDGETRTISYTNGSTAVGSFTALTGATNGALNVQVGTTSTATATATSGNVGGYQATLNNPWLAPPHFLYLNGFTQTFNSVSTELPCTFTINDVTDLGNFTGLATRRPNASGSLLSLKVELSNNNFVNGYVCYRPDGLADFLNTGVAPGAVISNVLGVFNSSVATSDGVNACWGVRFPTSTPYIDVVIENMTLIDTSTTPTQFPFLGIATSNSTRCAVKNLKVYMYDAPVNGSNAPGPQWGGTNMSMQMESFFTQFSNAQTSLAAFSNYGTATATNSKFDITVHGWRQFPVTFSGALSNGATTATLASNWVYATGNYQILFSNGNIRHFTFTNGSTTVGSFLALTSSATASATATGALNNNFNGYKSRLLLNQGGASTGNYLEFNDVTNGYKATIEGGLLTENYNFQWTGTPVSGGAYTLPVVFPTTMTLDKYAISVTTALGTGGSLTTFGLGTNTNATAVTSAHAISTGNTPVGPISVSMAGTSGALILTPTSGTFDGTGLLTLGARGTQISISA
jgi:hypothetical protein